jgi:fructose-bisphosphate aldolase class II
VSLVTTQKMFKQAYDNGFAVGAFNVNNMEQIQAIVEACHEENAPLILQISKGARKYADMDYLKGLIDVAVKKNPDVPIVVHLDHGDEQTAMACIDEGYNSVMIDASGEKYEKNVEITKRVCDYAHMHGTVVEAELGQLGGVEEHVEGVDPHKLEEAFREYLADYMAGNRDNIPAEIVELFQSHLTDSDQAVDFVQKTGCDSLAVACGTSHGAYKFKHTPILALPLFDQIAKKLPGFPLVMHGSSSVPQNLVALINRYFVLDRNNSDMVKKIKEGDCWDQMPQSMGVPESAIAEAAKKAVCKVNIDTDLRLALTSAILKTWGECNEKVLEWIEKGQKDKRPEFIFDFRKYLAPGRDCMREVVRGKLHALGCAGKASLCL